MIYHKGAEVGAAPQELCPHMASYQALACFEGMCSWWGEEQGCILLLVERWMAEGLEVKE